MIIRVFIFIFSLTILGCIEMGAPFDKIPPGIWRAELELQENINLPFNFEVTYNAQGEIVIDLINGDERINVPNVEFGRNKKLLDTIRIDFPIMDTHIKGIYKENVIEGYWTVRYRENYRIPFVAYFGQAHRFSQTTLAPVIDVSGTWQAIFDLETEDEYPAIGEFDMNNNRLLGTFLTETGDYRYLDGEVQGNQLNLSCFDGSHAFLFNATINDDESLIGKFYSGSHYETNWIAHKNEKAKLTDPYKLTQPLYPDKKLEFSLSNTKGETLSLNDKKYKGKAKLVMLMGTWCPNCLDESKFILNYLENNPSIDLEIIAIAFERYRDPIKSLKSISNYKNRLNLPYEILHGGYYDKAEATENFKYLDEIISYPTLLFVDKNDKVTKVHTGFAGPATSKYDDFVVEFDKEVKSLTTK